MKKIAALALAVVLICTMSLTAFAEFHPSVDGHCGHKVDSVMINGKEVDPDKLEEAILLISAEDAAKANEGLDPDKPDQMTSTGLTFAENAALVDVSEAARTLHSVPAYIAAHELSNKDADLPLDTAKKTLDMTEEELDTFDFVHFFIMKADTAKLREAAGLAEGEEITSLELAFDCNHMTNTTIALHEENILVEDTSKIVEEVDGKTVIHAEDVDFGTDKAKAGSYTVCLDLAKGETLSEHSLFTIVARER